ncbi:MAG: hypothetical protein IR164_16015 [Devosia sp.]|uniref:hypothetical protein n=1 Tax=Devosia sp. TaxID=1871048 RepID=UPI001A03DD91|nr:hypothetical protein [Devosia sp.]MBF0680434.1 hypothetical protein [Devosia sp.]
MALPDFPTAGAAEISGTSSDDMINGGHRTRFFPLLNAVLALASWHRPLRGRSKRNVDGSDFYFWHGDNSAALCVGTLFVIAGGARLATANGLANFTPRSLPAGAYVDLLAGVPGRLFAGGSETWLTATDGAAWSAPADNPYKGAATRPRAAYKADGRWVVHWADGNLSVSENDADWTKIDSPGLPAQPFTVAWAI